MRRLFTFVALTTLAAGPLPAAEPDRPRPTDRPAPLSDEVRAEIRALLRHVERSAKPGFSKAAVTIEDARRYAGVPPRMDWQGEFGEWFVFGVRSPTGAPDRWSGVYFVRKGSNILGYYRETW